MKLVLLALMTAVFTMGFSQSSSKRIGVKVKGLGVAFMPEDIQFKAIAEYEYLQALP